MDRPDLEAEKRRTLRRMKVGLILLLTASAGLIAVFAEAQPLEILAALGGGFVAGVVLQWVVFPTLDSE